MWSNCGLIWKVTFDAMFGIIFRQHKGNSVYSCNILTISNVVQLLFEFIVIKLLIGISKLGIWLKVFPLFFQVNYHLQGSEGLF